MTSPLTTEIINEDRRRLLSAAALGVVVGV